MWRATACEEVGSVLEKESATQKGSAVRPACSSSATTSTPGMWQLGDAHCARSHRTRVPRVSRQSDPGTGIRPKHAACALGITSRSSAKPTKCAAPTSGDAVPGSADCGSGAGAYGGSDGAARLREGLTRERRHSREDFGIRNKNSLLKIHFSANWMTSESCRSTFGGKS